ncbi:MAG: hypothetical protein ACM3ML_18815 [Micromonosporaceae bacterium]
MSFRTKGDIAAAKSMPAARRRFRARIRAWPADMEYGPNPDSTNECYGLTASQMVSTGECPAYSAFLSSMCVRRDDG